ncbi:MAG: acyltransferase [Phycisphaeraceae bacterium]|nr:acyltransferase [Phycisphaeraceae bacterium]
MNEQPLIEEIGASSASAFRQYQDMYVGRRSLWRLCRYELLIGVLSGMPGALGYLLRSRCYRWLLGSMGRKSVIGRWVNLRSPGRIHLGVRVLVDDLAVIDAKGDQSEITVGDQVLIGRGCILSCNQARIRLGNYVSMGPSCYLSSRSHIDIGSNVSIGPGSQLLAGSHAFEDVDTPIIKQKRVSKGITLGDGIWLGAGVIVLDGVTIGRDVIIGSGAVVKDDIPDGAVAVGVPAKILYSRYDRRAEKTDGPPAKEPAST